MKHPRSTVVTSISVILFLCFVPVLAPFAYDEVIFPLGAIMLSPHPAKIDFPAARQVTVIPADNYYDLIWSDHGIKLSLYASNWRQSTPDAPASVTVLDVQRNVVVDAFQQASNVFPFEELSAKLDLEGEERVWAECSLKNLIISGKYIDENMWELNLWHDNERTQSFTFSPVYPGFIPGHQSPAFHSFSQSCTYFVLTFEGWRYDEGEARHELWLLDIAANTLTPIVIGRWPLGGMLDYPVQSVRPDWSPDENELVFGDPTFGLEIYNIEAETRRWLASPKQKAWGPKWSSSAQWIAAEQWLTEYHSIMIMSSDGKQFASTGKCDFIVSMEWSPTIDQLAFLCSDSEKNEDSLWIWTVE